MKRVFAGIVVALCILPQWAQAQVAGANPRYNVIELAANVQREVANDWMTAQLFVEFNDANPANLANQLNRTVSEGLRIAKEHGAVKVRTGNNQTYPIYGRNNQVQGWRGRAELRLETRDFAAGAALVGKLQATMQLAGMQFAVSPEARQKAENEMLADAIAAFRARAEIAKTALGGKSYRIQRLGLNTSSSGAPPRPMLRAMATEAAMAAPPVEAGESVILVNASGSVEID